MTCGPTAGMTGELQCIHNWKSAVKLCQLSPQCGAGHEARWGFRKESAFCIGGMPNAPWSVTNLLADITHCKPGGTVSEACDRRARAHIGHCLHTATTGVLHQHCASEIWEVCAECLPACFWLCLA